MRTVLVLATLAACGHPAPPPTVASNHVARPAAPTTPAPSVRIAGERFETQRLPAAGRDGTVVVVPITDPDGGRGWPNLELQVRDGSDALVGTLPVMIANDYETLFVDGQATPALTARVTAANQQLADLHAEHDLVAMTEVPLPARLAGIEKRWPARTVARCAGENPGRVGAAYQAPGIDVLVVRITYAGTDTCWEPADELHVVR